MAQPQLWANVLESPVLEILGKLIRRTVFDRLWPGLPRLGLFTTSWQIIAQKPMTRMSDLP